MLIARLLTVLSAVGKGHREPQHWAASALDSANNESAPSSAAHRLILHHHINATVRLVPAQDVVKHNATVLTRGDNASSFADSKIHDKTLTRVMELSRVLTPAQSRLERCQATGLLKLVRPIGFSRTYVGRGTTAFAGWQFLHVYKAGGTSMAAAMRGVNEATAMKLSGATRPARGLPMFATLREPLERFLSGFGEALRRIHKGHYSTAHPLYAIAIDGRLSAGEVLDATLQHLRDGRHAPADWQGHCEAHMRPATRFLLDPATRRPWQQLRALLLLENASTVFNRTLPHINVEPHHSAPDDNSGDGPRDAMSARFSMREADLQPAQLRAICDLLVADYACLGFDLPHGCRDENKSTTSPLWREAMYVPEHNQSKGGWRA